MSDQAQSVHIAQVRLLAHKLIQTGQCASSHRLLLEALMTAYVAVAESYPCCTREAHGTALRCAERLARTADAAGSAPSSTPIH